MIKNHRFSLINKFYDWIKQFYRLRLLNKKLLRILQSENYNIIKSIFIRIRKRLKFNHRVLKNDKIKTNAKIFFVVQIEFNKKIIKDYDRDMLHAYF